MTFAAGLVSGGLRPVVSIYSTFLQRAYDQLIHDICLNELPVIFAVDRSGIVGRDGDTHQGIFDISYLTSIPNMTVLSPMDGRELEQCLDFAYEQDGPVAVRYPRGDIYEERREEIICEKPWEPGRARILMERGRLLEENEREDQRGCSAFCGRKYDGDGAGCRAAAAGKEHSMYCGKYEICKTI